MHTDSLRGSRIRQAVGILALGALLYVATTSLSPMLKVSAAAGDDRKSGAPAQQAIDSSPSSPVNSAQASSGTSRVWLPVTTKNTTVSAPPPSSCETRGTWLNSSALSRGDALLDQLQQARINTLFVIAPAVGGNNGWSNASQFQSFTSKARARGMSVHGWLANMYRVSGQEADYASSSEQQAQANWAVALLDAYPQLNGVHFDYIRYSTYAAIDSTKMNGVAQTLAKAHSAITAKYPTKVLTSSSFTDDPRWGDTWEAIPSWFLGYRSGDSTHYYGSSYVPQSMKYQQDPVAWIKNGYVDAIAPMQYTMSDSSWNGETLALKNMLSYQQSNTGKAYLGLTWMKPDSSNGSGWDAPGDVRKIKYARSIGMKGFVFFEFSEYTNGAYVDDTPLINALTVPSSSNNYAPPFTSAVPSCLPQ